MSVPTKIDTWQMVEPGKLERTSIDVPELKPGEVLVEVAGCGVCHTDVGYFYDGVPTVNNASNPGTRGKRNNSGGRRLFNRQRGYNSGCYACNNCDICASGRGNRCLKQRCPAT